ncbi:ATP-binding cassette domain-containing protein [Methanothrix sp.]|uniref:ATP-binding cassette domain-containing protein n=1 Tax=Methanothrix sp. TaxID=90426 RepID=UPI0032980EE0
MAFGLHARRLSRALVEKKVLDHLKSAGLWDIRKAKASDVSGGQRQRVALARALIIEPDLLLLDEPLSALDIRKQETMRQELRQRVQACHVPSIVVTHDLRDVASIGDRACLLERGRIALTGGPKEVIGWDSEDAERHPLNSNL